jgi:glycosyltransferase involved in cell wall biosynthesis
MLSSSMMPPGAERGGPQSCLSVVVPVYNEAETLGALCERLASILDGIDMGAEVLLVDDGSSDASAALMLEQANRDPRFKIVQLSRNFGHQVAITAGLDLAMGDAVVVMDADLQHPPETIPALVARWREGYDVVYGVRIDRSGDPRLKRTTAVLFYKLLMRLSSSSMSAHVQDFRLIDRAALNAFLAMRESQRYVRGMMSWIGFDQVGVPYGYAGRYAGESKYTWRRMMKLAADGVMSFSTAPLRLALHAGFVVSALALLYGLAAILARVGGWSAVPGWTSLLVVTAFLGGVQLMVLGMVGEYLGRVWEEVKARPLYIVRAVEGIDAETVDIARVVVPTRSEVRAVPPSAQRTRATDAPPTP